ncbi:MAG TPA: accessory factor UbiK family protein [Usitatibacteraceae bacterium]|nr:accessory factor UbiK family protein [Usitatibacteraceae bacterium]
MSTPLSASALDALTRAAEKIDSAIRASPLSDLEKNARAQFIAKLAERGLVTREEYAAQGRMLEAARAKLAELEARLAELEARQTAGTR